MEKNKKTVLVVDDEPEIVNVVQAYLEKEGYRVVAAYNGKQALDIFNENVIEFIILDLMLPDLSGEEVCKRIRSLSNVPILMLTAKVEESDRIHGLDLGADDYLLKPFSPSELVARVRAILRRASKEDVKARILEFNNGDLTLDLTNMEARKKEKIVELTNTEYKLLVLFVRNPGRTFTREELIIKILGYDYEGFDRTIDTHIKNIRQKIEDNKIKYIYTVYGIGYKFVGANHVKQS